MESQSMLLDHLPQSRQEMLQVIKLRGEVDADALALHLHMTVSGARQHIMALHRDGLVQHRARRSGPGRPRFLYSLTPAGDALFPRNYAELANELLDYVGEEDPDLLQRAFDRRAARRLKKAEVRIHGLAFAEKVREVACILDEDGYLADFSEQADGSYLLTEHNCAVLAIAQRYQHACNCELDLLKALLPEAEVTRVAHRLNGSYVCAYQITRVTNS
jgi:DeoR family transcriptional regulator, suf operon transcriptional repressor